MPWTIEYFEQEDTRQPAEEFEDRLERQHPKLAAKMIAIFEEVESQGHQLGGGYIEPCRNYPGLWEARAISQKFLGREFFGFDGQRAVLLHGYVKRDGEPASERDLAKASALWQQYLSTRRISPEEEEND
jgi:hypothetical protein